MKTLLKNYDKEKVNVFINYLTALRSEKKDGKQVNWWLKGIKNEELAAAFIKVASTGLYIDGDMVTLSYRKRLVITYDYHAYQNKILLTYPETIFDFGLVHSGDEFNISKESGKIIYSHKIKNPFADNKDIVGAYGIIKNSKGEFIETINLKDIEKMKKSSTMSFIWNTWFDRMVLKSVIKRICSTHFKDIVKEIDTQDNEYIDPTRASIDSEILSLIDSASTQEQLTDIYKSNISKIEDSEERELFISLLGKRKGELSK